MLGFTPLATRASFYIGACGLAVIVGQRVFGFTQHDNRFAGNFDQPILTKCFKHPTGHFSRAAYNLAQLLAGNPNLHALGVRHGIGLIR